MIKLIITLLLAVSFSTQLFAALNNPFSKASNVVVSENIQWQIKKGVADKTAATSDKDGTYFQLRMTASQINLRFLKSTSGALQNFDQLTIEDVQFDGKSSTLFQWCLNNQDGHNRFLQQGLSVAKNICQNKGKQGFFAMKLNQETYNLLKTTKNIRFVIKPYRSAVNVSFEVADMTKVFAGIRGVKKTVTVKKPAEKFYSKPNTPKKAAVAVVKPKAKLCSIKAPAEFPAIKTQKYTCNNAAAKSGARKKMAASVSTARAKKTKQEKQAIASRQKSEKSLADQKQRDEEIRRETAAVTVIEQNTLKIQSQVSEKMIGMCKKKWAEGEHRCYCEPYLEFAPAGIKSDASCSGS